MSELALETLLEATLFGSGKSLAVKELSEALGYEEKRFQKHLLPCNQRLSEGEEALYAL